VKVGWWWCANVGAAERKTVITGNLIVGQSGGATAVINASLWGVIAAASQSQAVGEIIGMRFGVEGLLKEELIDLRRQSTATLARLRTTPAAALGACRHRLTAEEVERALALCQRYSVRYFVYIGGNDSADTAHLLHRLAAARGVDLRVISVPKTIDNDLPVTDHCPGYGSIARFVATATQDSGKDTEAQATIYPVKVIEVMGRNAGWVAAASWLAKRSPEDAPQLVYLPERPVVSVEELLGEIQATQRRFGRAVVVLPETMKDAAGRPIGGSEPVFIDSFGHRYFASPAERLTQLIRSELGLRARYDKPGTIQRMSMALSSPVDLAEAEAAGREGVRLALAGQSDRMVTLVRESQQPYRCGFGSVELTAIANTERHLPDDFIGADGRSLTAAFVDYARPLLGDDLPDYARLAPLPVSPG
jgi:6-phosphofructokinase 1